ncbi:hypothetical protein AGMMS49959_16030 [Planctomycetales bacterium]|nr:hypothetical protein AGMMS49959_16030 [Planctomycetales bacterium]
MATNWRRKIGRLPARGAAWLVTWLYQRGVGRLLPKVCLYEPSCSNYMIEALTKHGLLKGVGLGLWRICRCHPFATGGYDPVPDGADD